MKKIQCTIGHKIAIFALLCAIISWCCVIGPRNAHAVIKAGPVRVHPGLEIGEVYDSNIFKTAKDKQYDWITEIAPSLGLDLPVQGRHSVHLGYNGIGYVHDRDGSEDHYDQTWDGLLDLAFPGGLTGQVYGSFTDATMERTAEVGRQRDYDNYNTGIDLGYAFADRWRARISYDYLKLDFEKRIDEPQNYFTNSVGGMLQYRVMPRTWALVEAGYAAKRFDVARIGVSEKEDNDVFSTFAGVEWDPAGKLKGELKVGYAWKDFEDNRPDRDNSPTDWSLGVGLTWDINMRTMLRLSAMRGFDDDIDFQNASYVKSIYRIDFKRRLQPKLSVQLYGSWANNDYEDKVTEPATGLLKNREDDITGTGAGLRYDAKDWLYGSINWDYEEKDSDFDEFSYNDSRLSFNIGISY